MDDVESTFLADLNAAAVKTETSPLHSEPSSHQNVPVRRCDTCGRACGCGDDLSFHSNRVGPLNERIRGQGTAPIRENGNGDRRPVTARHSTSQRVESCWTGM